MPILSPLERRGWGGRLLVSVVYLVLSLGAVTMLYPFLVMIGTSVTSGVDYQEYRIVPRYFTERVALYRKHVEEKYGGRIDRLNALYGTDFTKFAEVQPPEAPPGIAEIVREWRAMAAELPAEYRQPAYVSGPNIGGVAELERRYQAMLRGKYGSVEGVNRAYRDTLPRLSLALPPFEELAAPEWRDPEDARYRDWRQFKQSLSPRWFIPVSGDAAFRAYLKTRYADLAALNRAWGTRYAEWGEVVLAPAPAFESARSLAPRGRRGSRGAPDEGAGPAGARPRASVGSSESRPRSGGRPTPECVLQTEGTERLRRPQRARLHATGPDPDLARFVAREWPARFVRRDGDGAWVASAENLFRRRIAARYGEIRQANAAFGTRYRSFDEIPGPYALVDWEETREEAAPMRAHFAARNYRVVLDFFATEGRSLWNTALFCLGAILVALTINPLCAYALSRFQLSAGFRILLFLLATIAFPAEVSMIPSFLLLKQLGMLNTFWALILPGAANGYSIFLLKGFFDSLPLDLYEAGMLDGASELTLFRKVTLPLSTPILAVIALGAFTAAYGAFLFAMVVCQDPRMWTVMVHVYQIQVSEPRFVLMAALVLASLPTLLVFLFSQRVIMRGIILPSYK